MTIPQSPCSEHIIFCLAEISVPFSTQRPQRWIIIPFCSSLKCEYSFLFALVWFLPADSSSCCDLNLSQAALKKGLIVSSTHLCTGTCVWSSWLFLPYTRISGPGHVCCVLPGIQLFTPLRTGFAFSLTRVVQLGTWWYNLPSPFNYFSANPSFLLLLSATKSPWQITLSFN